MRSDMILLETQEITKTYKLGEIALHALNNVSLRNRKGEFISNYGAFWFGQIHVHEYSGCLDRPTRGRYLLEGVDVAHMNRMSWQALGTKR